MRHEIDGPLPDGRIVVDEYGAPTGPVLVWLHSEWGEYAEPPVEPEVLETARVLVVHHPGWGVSTSARPFPNLVELATAYWWTLDQLGVGSAALAGHGIGATIGAEMGVQQPSRTTALVLATPFGIFDDEHPGVDMFGLMARDVQRHLYADPTGPVALAHNPPSADAYEQGLAAIRRVQTLGAASNYLFPVPDTGIAARLYRVAGVPTVLLWGGRDGVVPADSARGWTRLLPEATSEVVPEAAHMLPYESDAVSTHLHRLLVG